MRSRHLTHTQLLTLPINPQDPSRVDICHGRNSLVHAATRNAVLVGGRDTAIHIKSGADGDAESAEFIMPGLHVCHRFNSVLDTCSPPRLWPRTRCPRSGLPSGPMPDWASGSCFAFLCKLSAHFHDLEQARSTFFSAVLSFGRQRRVFTLF